MQTGVILGFMAWASCMFLWHNLPHSVKLWTLRHHILTDIITGMVVYYSMSMFSKSIVCMVATVTAPLLMNFTMWGLSTSSARERLGLVEPPPKSLRDRFKSVRRS